jgi:hypothetical protein
MKHANTASFATARPSVEHAAERCDIGHVFDVDTAVERVADNTYVANLTDRCTGFSAVSRHATCATATRRRTSTFWDPKGTLVAQSRQLALLPNSR